MSGMFLGTSQLLLAHIWGKWVIVVAAITLGLSAHSEEHGLVVCRLGDVLPIPNGGILCCAVPCFHACVHDVQ